VFASIDLAVRDAALGDFSRYVAARISDHVPLIVDLEPADGG